MDKSNISDIDYTYIIKIFDQPTTITKRGVQYYIFKDKVEVSKQFFGICLWLFD
jgi:hypothetical protein